MDAELKAVLESMQQETREMRAEMNERFDGVDARLDVIDGRLDGHDARFDAIDSRLDAHDARFESVDSRFDRMERENAAAHAETRRHTQVLLESFYNPKFEVLAEAFALLDERVTREIAEIRKERR